MAKKRKLVASPSADRGEMLGLLAAAKADPWADGPRLALADWLEEHGGEAERARAEVLRLQLDAEAGGPPWGQSVERLRQRHVHEWLGAHRGLFRGALPRCERGLLAVALPANRWPADAAPDEAWHWVETARPGTVAHKDLPGLMASPLMATVTCLDLGYKEWSGKATLPLLAASGRLRWLGLGWHDKHLAALADGLRPGLRGLRLNVSHHVPAGHWERLLRSDGVAGLRRLSLPASSPPKRKLLAGLTALESLSVSLYSDEKYPLEALCPPALRSLHTEGGAHGLDAFARLADAPCGGTLEEVQFRSPFGKGECAPFRLPRLRRLFLDKAYLDAEKVASLAERGAFAGLSWLDLSHDQQVGAEGAAALAASCPQGPRRLDLTGCGLGDDGVRRLAAWPGLAGVRVLLLGGNDVGDEGARALAGSPHAALEALGLDANPRLTSAGVDALLASPATARLVWLSVERYGPPPPSMSSEWLEWDARRRQRVYPPATPTGDVSRLRELVV